MWQYFEHTLSEKAIQLLLFLSCASVASYMPKWRWCIMCVHASECAYVQRTLCEGAFSLATELWTTGFVVCLGSQGGSWMMLPQLSEERPRLASSRTALTGYHSRNCGLCPHSLEKIKEKRGKKKKAVSKGLGRVSLFQQMLEHCVVTLEARIHNGAYLTLWHHQRACCVGLPDSRLYNILKAPVNNSETAFTSAGAFSNIQGKPGKFPKQIHSHLQYILLFKVLHSACTHECQNLFFFFLIPVCGTVC